MHIIISTITTIIVTVNVIAIIIVDVVIIISITCHRGNIGWAVSVKKVSTSARHGMQILSAERPVFYSVVVPHTPRVLFIFVHDE